MLGTTLQGPVVALSGECEICVCWQLCFAIFRRLALHLQPRAEPTPVETVVTKPPAFPPLAGNAKRGSSLRSKLRERLEHDRAMCGARQALP